MDNSLSVGHYAFQYMNAISQAYRWSEEKSGHEPKAIIYKLATCKFWDNAQQLYCTLETDWETQSEPMAEVYVWSDWWRSIAGRGQERATTMRVLRHGNSSYCHAWKDVWILHETRWDIFLFFLSFDSVYSESFIICVNQSHLTSFTFTLKEARWYEWINQMV